jgi:PAS domain S-box-containing protein
MEDTASPVCLGNGCGGRIVLARSENADLNSVTSLAERMFHVPVAYAALLGHHDRVMNRVGSGQSHWRNLKTFPLQRCLEAPIVVRDARVGIPSGTDLGELLFLATAPILTICGETLGVLVIADVLPRPSFADPDLAALQELAAIIAGHFELRMVASQLVDSKLRNGETEERFRNVANWAPLLIACDQADGSCEFVNDAWLKFTGRTLQSEVGDGWQHALHGSYQDRVRDLYWQALHTRQEFVLEAPLRRHDGMFRWMGGRGSPRFLRDHSFAGFLVCLIEGTDYMGG